MGDTTNQMYCTRCNKTFAKKGYFVRHVTKGRCFRPKETPRNVDKYKCPLCGVSNSVNFEQFKGHVLEFHGVSLEMHFFKFQLQARFLAWKKRVEEQTMSSYVKESMVFKKNILVENKPCISKKVGVIHYRCHRSGYVRIHKDESERKRRFKTQGSAKINAFCPAKISAEFRRNGSVKVVYCSTHVGHECEVTHLRLTEDERKEIAAKVAAKIPFDIILDEIRCTAGSSISRKHILSKKHLRQIKQSLLKKGDQSKEILLASNNDHFDIEFPSNVKSLEHSLTSSKPDEIEDMEIQTFDPNDPDSDLEMLPKCVEVNNTQSHSEFDVIGKSRRGPKLVSKYKDQLENRTSIIFRSKPNPSAHKNLNLDGLTVSQGQSHLIERFRSSVNKLESLNDIKWVENHINRMFIVLKSIQDRRNIRKKESAQRSSLSRKIRPTSQKKSRSKLLPATSPQSLSPKMDFQADVVTTQPILKNDQQKSACHPVPQSVSTKKADLKLSDDTNTQSSCSLQMKQYLVPIAGEPDRFLIVQAKANEPPPVGPLTPVTTKHNPPNIRNIAVMDHNYSSLL